MANRWTAKPLHRGRWTSELEESERELARHGFALAVWTRAGRVLVTVGERMRPGIEPEHGEDGSPFAVVWLVAATCGEVAAFAAGMSAGALTARRNYSASQEVSAARNF